MGKRICLVTTTSIAHNPRLLKEADAFHTAGYDVRVVASQNLGWVALYDSELMRRRTWRHEAVSIVRENPSGRRLFMLTRLRSHLAQRVLANLTLAGGVAEYSLVRTYPELLAVAGREPADIFIAHALRALPVAARAAARHHAYLGFDAEDFHTGELSGVEHNSAAQRIVEYIEAKYIRRCTYVSAPSAPIADALAARYHIPLPLVIHNVFPWSDRSTLDGQIKDRCGSALSLFWFSQTVGLNRGIQDAIRAAGLLSEPVQIHLRGSVSQDVRDKLMLLAQACGVAEQLYFHPQVPPEELLSRTAEHDVGLAVDTGQAHSLSNELTVTNKFFVYMLAGLAIAASRTKGQVGIMESSPQVGALYTPSDYQALATLLHQWQTSTYALATAKSASLEAARRRWNWEYEQNTLLNKVAQLLEPVNEARSSSRP